MVKYSIIIPVYNQEELVIKALDSCPRRDDTEVIVIDDGSTDNTWNNLIKYKSNLHLKLYHLTNNMGLGYCRDIALDLMSGEYLISCDSDDYFNTDRLNTILDSLKEGYDIHKFPIMINSGEILKPENTCAMHTMIISKKFIGDLRFEHRRVAEDWPFVEALKARNPRTLIYKQYFYHYNFPRKGSISDLNFK